MRVGRDRVQRLKNGRSRPKKRPLPLEQLPDCGIVLHQNVPLHDGEREVKIADLPARFDRLRG